MEHTLNYKNFEIKTNDSIFNIKDYTSLCFSKIKYYLKSLPSYYLKYLKIEQGAKIEKICYDYYKNSSYYDIICLLNDRDMIYDMPYPNDIILSAVEQDINEYKNKVFLDPSKEFSEQAYNDLNNSLLRKYESNNIKFQFLKVINPTLITQVVFDINSIVEKYQDNIELLDLEEN